MVEIYNGRSRKLLAAPDMADNARMFPVSDRLLGHRRKMGSSIWEYLWLRAHVTTENSTVDGKFVGGKFGLNEPKVTVDLPGAAGAHSLTVFYADRAQVGAYLGLSIPEPGIWLLMGIGIGALGAGLRYNRSVTHRLGRPKSAAV